MATCLRTDTHKIRPKPPTAGVQLVDLTSINEMNTMPADLIAKLVGDFYDEKEVVGEKACLLSHLPPTNTSQRHVRRKGANKKTMNIQDILHILFNFEVDDIPCFVARYLSNLPPLTQDHFDLASVMRNLTNMQHELSNLTTLKYDVNILQAQITDISQRRHADDSDHQISQSQDDDRSADAVLTPARRYRVDSSMVNDQTPPTTFTANEQTTPTRSTANKQTLTTTSTSNDQTLTATQTPCVSALKATATDDQPNALPRLSYSQCVRDGVSLSDTARDREEATERVRSEHNTDTVIGSAKSTTLTIRSSQRARSTAADNDRCGLFITRFHANTSEAELNEYVRKIAGCRVRTQKLKTKFNTYSSFYIPLSRVSWCILLEASIWPQGVLIK